MKEVKNNIPNIQNSYSSKMDEYSFTVGKGKNTKSVIIKLDISPNEEVTTQDITDGLVKYLNAIEDILA